MAVTADLKSVAIKVVKGNGLAELYTEDFNKGVFQSALADGVDRNKAVHIKTQVAALGARGDYIELVAFVTAGTAGNIPASDTFYIDVLDYTGVPVAVQHTVFGKYSPFVTPHESMQEGMLDGIDRQELAIVNDAAIASEAACSTPKTQTVRGDLDDRVTLRADHLDCESWTKISLRLKPNSDGVFVIPAGAKIWVEPDADVFDATP